MDLQQTKVIGLGAAVAAGALSLPLLGQIDKATQGKYLYLSGAGAVGFGLGLGYFGRHPVFQGLGYALAAIGGYVLVADYQASTASKLTTTAGWVGATGGAAPPPSPQAPTVPVATRTPQVIAQQPTHHRGPRGSRGPHPYYGLNNVPNWGPTFGMLEAFYQTPQGTPEFPPPTPDPHPYKFPQDPPDPSEASQITVTPEPLPTRPATINPPSSAAYCYAAPEGGGPAVEIVKGTGVTIVGYPKVVAGTTYYLIHWYPNQSGWISANCLS